MNLRQYQRDLVEKVRIRRRRCSLIVLPTGGDKTIVMSEIIRHAENQHVLVLVHPWNNPEPPTPGGRRLRSLLPHQVRQGHAEGGGEWLGSGSARAKAGSNIEENS